MPKSHLLSSGSASGSPVIFPQQVIWMQCMLCDWTPCQVALQPRAYHQPGGMTNIWPASVCPAKRYLQLGLSVQLYIHITYPTHIQMYLVHIHTEDISIYPAYIFIYLFICVHLYFHIYIYIRIYIHMCVYVFMYVCMHVCMCMYVYVYIYIYIIIVIIVVIITITILLLLSIISMSYYILYIQLYTPSLYVYIYIWHILFHIYLPSARLN